MFVSNSEGKEEFVHNAASLVGNRILHLRYVKDILTHPKVKLQEAERIISNYHSETDFLCVRDDENGDEHRDDRS